jgi:FAD/FMN-containing dehydrogenase
MLTAPLPLSSSVIQPGDPGWDAARAAFNLLLDQQPAAIAFPASAEEGADVVACARAAGLRIAPQATAHGQGALGEMSGVLLINVSRLQEVHVDPGALRVRVGAGAKWERVVPRLSAHGLACLHGSSPDVGIAGYSLGGGMGWLARKHGLQANAVTALELVTADAQLLRVDAENHPDLFWALRGGGGNFGVVTAIEFSVLAVDELYAGALFFPFERSAEVLRSWSALLPSLPDELMSWASVIHFPPIPDVPAFARGKSFVVVMAAYLGTEADGRDLLWPLRELRPVRDTFAMVPPVVLADLAMDPLDPLPFHLTHALLDELPAATIDELMAKVGPGSGLGPTVTVLQFRHMGGALARTTPGAGARATLPGEVCMMALGVVMDEASDEAVRAALATIDATLAPQRAGDYPNFVEHPADASGFFAPAVWERLRAIKTTYDPEDVFAGGHHIPPA